MPWVQQALLAHTYLDLTHGERSMHSACAMRATHMASMRFHGAQTQVSTQIAEHASNTCQDTHAPTRKQP
eukprot:1188862-Alexandrium_andersonii.AAC.1